MSKSAQSSRGTRKPRAWTADPLIWHVLEAVRESVRRAAQGEVTPPVDLSAPLPFTRADGDDYLRLVKLWNEAGVLGRSELAARDCPACGSGGHRPLFQSYDGYPFHGCGNCGSWFVPLAVDESLIERFLAEVPEARRITDRMMQGREARTRTADRDRFFAYFDLVAPLLGPRPGRIRYLDIGCGVGHSVELAAELGFDATGLEVSRAALATAGQRGRNVHHPVEWQGSGPFDLISLFETLEHITDPHAVIRQASSLLAPGGVLIVTVPNGQCWEVQLLRERCFHVFGGFEGTGHINLFTPDGLGHLFARNGLALAHADGQFSNNPLDVAARLLDQRGDALAAFAKGTLAARLPAGLHEILNALGPDLAVLDRAALRSPILIAIACRSEDAVALAGDLELLRHKRSEAMQQALSVPIAPPGGRTCAPRDVAAISPLFPAAGARSIEGFLAPATARLLAERGFTGSVARGLSLRSAEPLHFERMATLGSGRLSAGRYELAARARIRAGLASVSLFDEERQVWAATIGFGPDDGEMRASFTLDDDSDVTLYVCAHNSDEPRATEVDVYAVGIAALDAGGRIIPPPPLPPRQWQPLLSHGARRVGDFLAGDAERLAGAQGAVESVRSAITYASAEPLRFERIAELGAGRLAPGRYQIAVRADVRAGHASLSLLDTASETWLASIDLEPGEDQRRTTFTLADETGVKLFLCAHNSRAPHPTEVIVAGLALASLDGAGRVVPAEAYDPKAPLFPAPITPFADFLAPEHAHLLGPGGTQPPVAAGLWLGSSTPLTFERMARLGAGRLAPGRYELAARARLGCGRVSFSLFDEQTQTWVASVGLEPGETLVRAAFTCPVDSDVTLYVCAHNSDAASPTEVEIAAVGLAPLDAEARLIPPAPAPADSVPAPMTMFAAGLEPIAGFLMPELAAVLAAPGSSPAVASGLSLRSAGALRFERMAALGRGRLAAGEYALAAQLQQRCGLVSIALLDEQSQSWIVSIALVPGQRELRGSFALAADGDVTLYICAHNSDEACPTEVDVLAVAIAGATPLAGLVPVPPVDDTPRLAPLFAAGRLPIAGFLEPETARLLASRGFVPEVAPGLALRSEAPLRFERMAALGAGRLAAGRYEVAAQALVRRGGVSFGLLDEARQVWICSIGLAAGETEIRTPVTLAADTDVSLWICAHNCEAPSAVEVDVVAAGIVGCDGDARLIAQPPAATDGLVEPAAPLFAPASEPVAGYIVPETERMLAAGGCTSGVAAGVSLRSAEPLRFERMARLGAGRLAAGTYELAIRARQRCGLVSLGLLDEAGQAWAVVIAMPADAVEARTTFTLTADIDSTLYLCANNSAHAHPTEVDIMAVGLAGLSEGAGLVEPAADSAEPEPGEQPAVQPLPARLFDEGRPLPRLLDRRIAELLGVKGLVEGVRGGLSLASDRPLRFEYIARLGAGRLRPGVYQLAAQAAVHAGRVSVSLLDEGRQTWLATLPFAAGRSEARHDIVLVADTDVVIYVCADNAEAAQPVCVDILAAGIAALSDSGDLVEPVAVQPVAA